MIAILNPNESLTAVMSGAAATTNPTYSVVWRESANDARNQPVGSLSGATAVTLVSAPAGGQRIVESVQIYNGDTASVTVTISKVVSGTSYTLSSVVLAAGSTLKIDDQGIVVSATATAAGVGAAAGTGVVASEQGNGAIQKTVLTLTDAPISVIDALAYGSQKIYDFPGGRILILGVTANLAFGVTSDRTSTINASAAMDWAIGTAAASNVTLATTMVDLIPKQDKDLDGVDAAYTTSQGAALAASAHFDGTGTAKDAYLNVSFPTGTDIDADGTLKVSGTVTIHWINLGDY